MVKYRLTYSSCILISVYVNNRLVLSFTWATMYKDSKFSGGSLYGGSKSWNPQPLNYYIFFLFLPFFLNPVGITFHNLWICKCNFRYGYVVVIVICRNSWFPWHQVATIIFFFIHDCMSITICSTIGLF